jgi:hypothetical protein
MQESEPPHSGESFFPPELREVYDRHIRDITDLARELSADPTPENTATLHALQAYLASLDERVDMAARIVQERLDARKFLNDRNFHNS